MPVKTTFEKKQAALRGQSGLTLVEMLVATSLLVVIMLGLTAMFNQTQRAFQSGLKQVDVFEGGRAVMDMITRDIEQLAASKNVENTTLYAGVAASTFLAQLPSSGTGSDLRTNVLYETLFLNHTTDWTAVGYRVLNSDTNQINSFNELAFGSLYRFSTDFPDFRTPTNFYLNLFASQPLTLFKDGYLNRVADGVVHFRLQFYNANGDLILSYNPAGNLITSNIPPDGVAVGTIDILPRERWITFNNDALPAMVEVELGILEPMTLKQANSISDAAARRRYLEKQAGKVHIFRQQIPIRTSRSWR